MTGTDWLSVRVAAEQVGVSVSLVYQWCADGTLPHYRLGAAGRRGKILIDPAELDKLWRSRSVKGGQPSSEPLRHIAAGPKR